MDWKAAASSAIEFIRDNFKSLVNASGISIKERFAAVSRQMVAQIERVR